MLQGELPHDGTIPQFTQLRERPAFFLPRRHFQAAAASLSSSVSGDSITTNELAYPRRTSAAAAQREGLFLTADRS